MTRIVRLRRGTRSEHVDGAGFTGSIAEVTVDTTNNTIRVHDGATKGGFESVGIAVTQRVINKDIVASQLTVSGVSTFAGINVSGISTFAVGSASTPSITPTGNSNTGIFFPTTNTTALSQNGVEALRIDSSGYAQGTPVGLGTGRIPAMQYFRLNSDLTGNGTTSAQSALGVGVSLVANTVYEFEGTYIMTRTGTGNPSISTLFARTNGLTLNNIAYFAVGQSDPASPSATVLAGGATDALAYAIITNGRAFAAISFRGTMSVNAAGTLTPQYQLSNTLSAGNEYSMKAGSYFRIFPLGASGSNTTIGSWT